jgi:uncharacterized protein (TIGR03382 family)
VPIGNYAVLVRSPGDQTDPSVSGDWVVFASSVSGDWDVRGYLIGSLPGTVPVLLAGGPGNQDQPDLHGNVLAYRAPEGVFVGRWTDPSVLEPIRWPGREGAACGPLAPESQPTVAEGVAAWECGTEGSRSIAVLNHRAAVPEYQIPPPGEGEQFAPASFGTLIAFLHGGPEGGSVWLHDSAGQGTVPICGGTATGVAVGQTGGRTVVAATRRSVRADADIEIWEPSVLVSTLAIPGEQRNPHLSADWVAFEDLSTGGSQVVLWQWTTGLVFLPHPSTAEQTLNDLDTTPGVEVRAVFAEKADGSSTGTDISRYRIVLDGDGNVIDDGTGNSWPWGPIVPPPSGRPLPASCDDADPDVIGTLSITRARGTPRAAAVDFAAQRWGDDPALPVLVCIEADGITAGWMTLDDEAIAWPRDFGHDRVKVAIPAVAKDVTARIAAVVGGKPGSSLTVRVLADPGRPPPHCGGEGTAADAGPEAVDNGREWDHDQDGDHDQGFGNSGWLRVAEDRFDRRVCGATPVPQPQAASGCTSGGPGGALALFALLLAAHLKRRR